MASLLKGAMGMHATIKVTYINNKQLKPLLILNLYLCLLTVIGMKKNVVCENILL